MVLGLIIGAAKCEVGWLLWVGVESVYLHLPPAIGKGHKVPDSRV